ncbi:N-acetylglucosamine kinase [Streptomyces antibioticus]|uniref:ATPase n=1 Tax=Streptomyces antibioticus TaxID=1890 RepID=A0AAE6Y3T4_STRAT|nr:BadF/BadG/BcrA/BcrD ATPase family protein [Streptomyces antibioticus]OOQ55234.1 ATPase [Streptomyces antibioticus]QIT42873.1 ATPase [Streptomyces antibioticus]
MTDPKDFTDTTRPAHGFLAVDSGGSGLRVAVGAVGGGAPAVRASGVPVRTGERGIDPDDLMSRLVPLVRALAAETGVERPATAVVGAAGLATLGDGLRAVLPGALAREFGVRTTALAADAVTAYVGALGVRPGAVVAAGTGLVAIGTDLTAWHRADGWGHLLGDCGGGAWIGRAGLEAALRAYDGRAGGSARLLASAERQFGPPQGLPGHVYPRPDRPAVLASFAPRVAQCAAEGDPVAVGVLRAAARHLAESAAAVCPADGEAVVALTGGLTGLGDPLLVPVAEEFARLLPRARRVPAEGDPLHGAVRMAVGLAAGPVGLPVDGTLFSVVRGVQADSGRDA